MSPINESIRKTLAYFDLFGYPLTKEELFAYLWQPPRISYEEFIPSVPLQGEGWGGVCNEKFGHYFFSGREGIIENRRQRLLISELKLKIAVRAAKKICAVPFLRAIFVCNSVGAGLARSESDIDFFIIAAPGRIWLVRFFSNLILKFWRLRTYGKKRKDKICLSFFVDEKHLNLQSLCALKDDIHFMYWLHQMIPVYDPKNIYHSFLDANRWTDEYLPNVKRISRSVYLGQLKEGKIGNAWRRIWEAMWGGGYGNILENQAKQFQLTRLKMTLKDTATRSDRSVVIEDGVLKFHENDSRKEIFDKWKLRAQYSENIYD
ncbi:MAG: hypothetical protein NTW66_02225 [Candidatus Magasanikbacteria bacterium]|nr:hypothetical protein [Candidatus Magasanikbacteria bacterium]